MPEPDLEDVNGPEELRARLRAHHLERRPVRVLGSGSRQQRLPAAEPGIPRLRLAGMRRIVRLEAGDLTCSVEPGIPRAELDRALADRGLCLPCAGGGTLGGLFATGEPGPLAPGAFSPRSLLVGLEGVLADGEAFKSGARVVKSVAGYDLHKAFVGSRGTLFVATQLHLKLRPAPREVTRWLARDLDLREALSLYSARRRRPVPPAAILLRRDMRGWSVFVRLEGRRTPPAPGAPFESVESDESLELVAPHGAEVVRGAVRPSLVDEFVGRLPERAEVLVDGCGGFQVVLEPGRSDRFLADCPRLGAMAEIACGAPHRRGRATPADPVAARLARALRKALDPHGVLR